ncbi:MAG: hypothetical protein ACKORK_03110 [Gemmatimonadota bacterium]
MADQLPNLLLAGFPKTGTTSLFTLLARHPDVGPSSVKEAEYFLPARYGEAMRPVEEYAALFEGTESAAVRMEATPAYVYGGAPVIGAVRNTLGAPKVLFTVREPVGRLRSYYRAQQARLRIPIEMTMEEYVACAATIGESSLSDRAADPWLGVLGGEYSRFVPSWVDAFDVRFVAFDELVDHTERVLVDLAGWLGIDPAPFAGMELPHENPSVLYKGKGLQRFALSFNHRLEPFLRRHPELKARMRAAYYRVNGRAVPKVEWSLDPAVGQRYADTNAALATIWTAVDPAPVPAWLTPAP